MGGLTGSQLAAALSRARVELNQYARELLASDALKRADAPYMCRTVDVSVGELGLLGGATIDALYDRALSVGLQLCPLSLGPHLRLAWLTQPDSRPSEPAAKNRAPEGSLTVGSVWSSESSHDPAHSAAGFYLRAVDGVQWLRGFCADRAHVWDRHDRFVFCVR